MPASCVRVVVAVVAIVVSLAKAPYDIFCQAYCLSLLRISFDCVEQTNAQSVINLQRHFALRCLTTTMTMIDGHVNWTVTGKVPRCLVVTPTSHFRLVQHLMASPVDSSTSHATLTWPMLWAAAHDRVASFRFIPFWPRLRSIAWPKNGTKVSTLVSVFGLKKMWDLPWLWSREDRTSYLNLSTAQPPVWTHSYSPLPLAPSSHLLGVRRVGKLIGYAK